MRFFQAVVRCAVALIVGCVGVSLGYAQNTSRPSTQAGEGVNVDLTEPGWWLARAAEEASIVPVGPRPVMEQLINYMNLADEQRRAGDAEGANRSEDLAIALDDHPQSFNGMALVGALSKARRFDQAQAIADGMSAGLMRHLAFGRLASELARSGDVARAEAVAARMPAPPASALDQTKGVYVAIAAAKIRAGDPEGARTTLATKQLLSDENLCQALLQGDDLDGAASASSRLEDSFSKARLLLSLADAFIKKGKNTEASDVLGSAESLMAGGTDPSPESAIAAAVARQELGNNSAELRDFDLARAEIEKMRGERGVVASGYLASTEAKAGYSSRAIEVLKGIQVRDGTDALAIRERREALVEMAHIQAALGDLTAARKSLEKIDGSRYITHDFVEIASEATPANRYSDYKEWAQTLGRAEFRFGVYLGVAQSILARKDRERRGVFPMTLPTTLP